MDVKLICVGRLKEQFYVDALEEFKKRISRYANVEIIEVADESAPEKLSEAQKSMVKSGEGKRILKRVSQSDMLIALSLDGKELTSEQIAQHMVGWMLSGRSSLCFVIGGSLGLSDEVLGKADFKLCFGKPTFSHQLFRVMLLEQIYRVFKIINNEPYHK